MEDLTGKVFGRWHVDSFAYKNKHRQLFWNCTCECGTQKVVMGQSLRQNKSRSCGCLQKEQLRERNFKDLTGQMFGKLYVLEDYRDESKPKGNQHYCKCLCTGCNSIVDIPRASLVSGNTKSCGCWHGEYHKTHGMSKTKFYKVYSSMLARCNNILHQAYIHYGARGIKVCDRWQGKNGFIHFKEDMYESYLEHIEKYGELGTSLDRIDNNSNYCKENCRWATYEEQGNNKRNTRYVLDGNTNEEMPISLYCKKYNYDVYEVISTHNIFYK